MAEMGSRGKQKQVRGMGAGSSCIVALSSFAFIAAKCILAAICHVEETILVFVCIVYLVQQKDDTSMNSDHLRSELDFARHF